MKKARRALLWAALLAVAALSCLAPEQRAGLEREELLRVRYGGWAGVLRLWMFEDWDSGGSLAAWLSDAVGAFEKAHPGVYIQLTGVGGEPLRAFAASAANPPDMILFPPGLLDGPASLLALPGAWSLRAGLEGCGVVGEARFALPVAMGVYGLAFNRAVLEGLPATWNELPETPPLAGCEVWLDWPADGAYLHWSRAMGDLLAPPSRAETAPQVPHAGEGLDLGLPASAEILLPKRLPADFGRAASVYKRFVNGEIAAMPVTQKEVVRLQRLSESGRGPDWAVATRVGGYTDLVALLAVTDCGKSQQAARQALCLDFAARLVSGETQAKLTKARAFPVIDLPPLYAGSEGMAQMEAGLAAARLEPAAAFGAQ